MSCCLPDADDAAGCIVSVGPSVDDEQKHTIGIAHRIPSLAVRIGIVSGQRQRIGQRDLANT